jgi:hypothetical protein
MGPSIPEVQIMRKALLVTLVAVVMVFSTAAAALAAHGRESARPGGDRLVAASDTEMTAEEAADLQFMREEEKLARDVYLALDAIWDQQVFTSIARSEQRHMDAVARLLDRYGIEDRAAMTARGEFENAGLQGLYDELIARGPTSLEEALRVGVLIEEADIADLVDAIAGTDLAAVRRVYERLLAASESHLRAFDRNLVEIGAVPSPS